MPSAYVNGYAPFDVKDLSGGLNLRDRADAVGDREAIDLLNVQFTERGAIRQRDGTARYTQAALPDRPNNLSAFYSITGARHLICGLPGRLVALDAGGVQIASTAFPGAGVWGMVRMGTQSGEYLYASSPGVAPGRWDGVSFTVPTATVNAAAGQAMPKAGVLASTGAAPGLTANTNAANRMVATAFANAANAGPGGFATNPSRVFFSQPGLPEQWETDGVQPSPTERTRGQNWIDLTVGDGEAIVGAVTWRELVFVFKETKFFVFWGETINPDDGTPMFNYREVVNQAGLAGRFALCAGRDGVYFFNRRGIYVTTGSEPTLLSDSISPLWMQDPDVYYSGQPINLTAVDAVRGLWHMERVFFAVPTGAATANDRLLVYDAQGKWWSVYDIPAAALASYRPAEDGTVYFARASGALAVDRHVRGAGADADAPIRSYWRSGWGDYGQSVQKTFREMKLWGSGAYDVAFSVDFNRASGATVQAVHDTETQWPSVVVPVSYLYARQVHADYTELRASVADYNHLLNFP